VKVNLNFEQSEESNYNITVSGVTWLQFKDCLALNGASFRSFIAALKAQSLSIYIQFCLEFYIEIYN
jgi:hypothetical protein